MAWPDPSLMAVTGPGRDRLYNVSVPIRMRGLRVGAVRLGISWAAADRMVRDLAQKVVAVLFCLMAVGIGSLWRFSGWMARLNWSRMCEVTKMDVKRLFAVVSLSGGVGQPVRPPPR